MNADQTLIRSYSQALFDAAVKAGTIEKIAEEAQMLLAMLREDKAFLTFMQAPNISRDDKERVMQQVFGSRVHTLIVNFIRMLIRRGRLEIILGVFEDFHFRYNEYKGVTEATVITASELSADQRQALEGALNAFMKLRLVINYKVDEQVLGGVRFKCGDTLMDTTLEANLASLRNNLGRVKVY